MEATLLGRPHVFERGDKVYLTTPLTVANPTEGQIEEFAFASAVKSKAPNDNIGWLQGRYVEGGNPNQNNALWLNNELALKALTPMLMPVTVMHDPRSAVGTIADCKLVNETGINSRIDTILAIWRHRFPQVWEEAEHNIGLGQMMQSMECVPLRSEILTRRGWRRWDELRPDDETVGYNPETDCNEWTRVRGVVRKRAEVVSLGHGRWRVDCTRGHRWLCAPGRRVGSRVEFDGPELVEAERLPRLGQLKLSARADLGGELPVTPAEARVIGWIAGDGSFRATKHAGEAVIFQSKPDGVMALEMALADAGVEYVRTSRMPGDVRRADGVLIQARRAINRYQLRGESIALIWRRAELDHLTWDAFVLKLSDEAREAWLDAMYEAEGNENHGSRCIAQRPGPLKDAVTLAAYLCGYRPSSRMGGDNSQASSHVRLCIDNVNTGSLGLISRGDDEVWCPVTDLGSWTMRQDGQVLLTGNCYAPWYLCSECGQQFIKLPNGAEQASWCAHLRADSSLGDLTPRGRRILGDTCFTGTGLIFGSRGGVGAYTEAHLDHFHDEVAEYHARAHVDGTYRPTVRSASQMTLVQIEDSELAALRRERDEAKVKADDLANANRDLTTKVETAEAAQKKAEDEKAAADTKVTDLEAKTQKSELASTRMGALGAGFLAKLGDTSKTVLTELAGASSDEQWDLALKEREELASKLAGKDIKRGDAGDGNTPPPAGGSESSGFQSVEVARVMGSGVATPPGGAAPAQDGATSIRQLARAMNKPRTPAGAAK